MQRTRLTVVALTVAAAIMMACGGDKGTGPGGSVDLTGNYSLVSLTFGGIPTTAGGTMAMTSTTFKDSIVVTAPIDTMIKLDGTYVTSGTSSITLTPTQPISPVTGTYARNAAGDTLRLNLSFSGTALVSVWRKQ
jgi:hypothetical protein